MKYILKVYSIWEYGQRKDAAGNPHQEDSLYPPFGHQTDTDRTFILCDGMGGHDAGEVASATVCETMARSILSDGHDDKGEFTLTDFNNALIAAFDALDAKDTGAEKKMGTTLAFLKLHNQGATIAHIGDSRVYHIRPGNDGESTRILFQTEDHSLVQELVKIGELTRAEARTSRQKNVITRAMQPSMERRPRADVYETADIRPGDFFYLCSDGMLEQPEMDDGISLRNIFSQQVADDVRRVEILKGATRENRDNHTAIIVHVLQVIDPVDKAAPDKAAVQHNARPAAQSFAKPRKKRSSAGIVFALISALAVIGICVFTLQLFKTPAPDVSGDKAGTEEVGGKVQSPAAAKKSVKSVVNSKTKPESGQVEEKSPADTSVLKTAKKDVEQIKADKSNDKKDQMTDIKEIIGKVSGEDPDPEPEVRDDQPAQPKPEPARPKQDPNQPKQDPVQPKQEDPFI